MKLKGDHQYWETLGALVKAQLAAKEEKDYLWIQCQLLAFSMTKQTEFISIALQHILDELESLRYDLTGQKR
jgi:hypothetical protein